MSSMEFNKIFAAVLVAGIVAMLTGFIARELVTPHELAKNAYVVDTSAITKNKKEEAKPAAPEPPIGPLLAAASPAEGQKLSHICMSCHDFTKGGPNKVGPNLWGIVGDHTAHKADYPYSDAIKKLNSTWDYESLNKFLTSPKAYAPGTKMTFAGFRSEKDRANLLSWLRLQNDNPPPLPK